MRKKKTIPERSIKALYIKCKKAYDESYAMMCDDIFDAGQAKAKELGVDWFYDAGLYPIFYRYISRYTPYTKEIYQEYLETLSN